MSKLKLLILSIIVVVAALAITTYFLFGPTLRNTQTSYVFIDPDDDIDSVCSKLNESVNPRTLSGFRMLAKLKDYDQHIRTGRYAIAPSTSVVGLFRKLRNHDQEPLNLVIPTTRTVPQLCGKLAEKLMADSLALLEALTDSARCAELGLSKETLPALIIPNTYEVYWDISPENFVSRMAKEHDRFWTDERKAAAQALGMTPEQVTTLASIVDSESNYTPEKPTIAGLYLNRLHKGIPLQSDPTVIFAIGDFSMRRVLNRDLAYDSPYNTYKYAGLPPGPIRIASIAGIDAALHPDKHNYLYMCAKEDFSGSHNFAVTYNEHQQNARRYVNALNQRGIRR